MCVHAVMMYAQTHFCAYYLVFIHSSALFLHHIWLIACLLYRKRKHKKRKCIFIHYASVMKLYLQWFCIQFALTSSSSRKKYIHMCMYVCVCTTETEHILHIYTNSAIYLCIPVNIPYKHTSLNTIQLMVKEGKK